MRKIDVCLSPDLIHLYDIRESAIVVVDIFRATSCMVTAFGNGANKILPVEDLELCRSKKKEGYLIAAERNGESPEGFDLGNSPFSFQEERIKGADICVTTTNGTVAIRRSSISPLVIIGAFLNLSKVVERLKNWERDVVVVCAGWKGRPNLEDSIFAGALIDALKEDYIYADDASLVCHKLFLEGKDNLLEYVKESSHVQRLKKLGIEKDIEFCLKKDYYEVLPILVGDYLTI